MIIRDIGYGAGKSIREDVPNLVRVISGVTQESGWNEETIGVIETNIDDMPPEYFSRLFERFFAHEGALDLSVQHLLMKKNRPGFQIQCLVEPHYIHHFMRMLFDETSTLGVRYRIDKRVSLPRSVKEVETPWGAVIVKTWQGLDGSVRIAPEYESCRALADKAGIPLRVIVEAVMKLQCC